MSSKKLIKATDQSTDALKVSIDSIKRKFVKRSKEIENLNNLQKKIVGMQISLFENLEKTIAVYEEKNGQ